MKHWFVIINPASGNNFVKKQKEKVLNSLQNLKKSYEVFYTSHSGHEEELVQLGVEKGFRNFISVGGDGTMNHVVNGVIKQKLISISEITIGAIPVGTGNDWVKNNNIPRDINQAIEILNQNKTAQLDIGKITHRNEIIYFNILVGIGYDGYVVDKAVKYKKWGKSAYLIASVLGFVKFKKSVLKYTFNTHILTINSLMAIVGIGKFCGSGMQLTTGADTQDGLFDITLVKDISVLTLFMNIKNLYNGKITTLKEVDVYKTNKIKIEHIGGPIPYIEADGELIGQGSFEVEMMPKALKFVVN